MRHKIGTMKSNFGILKIVKRKKALKMKWSATLPLWFGDGVQKLVSEELDRRMEISYIWLLNIIQVSQY